MPSRMGPHGSRPDDIPKSRVVIFGRAGSCRPALPGRGRAAGVLGKLRAVREPAGPRVPAVFSGSVGAGEGRVRAMRAVPCRRGARMIPRMHREVAGLGRLRRHRAQGEAAEGRRRRHSGPWGPPGLAGAEGGRTWGGGRAAQSLEGQGGAVRCTDAPARGEPGPRAECPVRPVGGKGRRLTLVNIGPSFPKSKCYWVIWAGTAPAVAGCKERTADTPTFAGLVWQGLWWDRQLR